MLPFIVFRQQVLRSAYGRCVLPAPGDAVRGMTEANDHARDAEKPATGGAWCDRRDNLTTLNRIKSHNKAGEFQVWFSFKLFGKDNLILAMKENSGRGLGCFGPVTLGMISICSTNFGLLSVCNVFSKILICAAGNRARSMHHGTDTMQIDTIRGNDSRKCFKRSSLASKALKVLSLWLGQRILHTEWV